MALAALVMAAQARAGDGDKCEAGVATDRNIRGCTEIIESSDTSDEDRVNALLSRGASYSGQHDLRSGMADLNQAIRLAPSDHRAYVLRCFLYAAQGKLDRGTEDCDKAVLLSPEDARAYAARCQIRHAKGDLDAALVDCDEAIRLDAENSKAYRTRGQIHALRGAYDQAITDLDKAIRLSPNDSGSYLLRAQAYHNMEAYGRAIADYDWVIRRAPENALALNGRAWTNVRRGEAEEGLRDIQKALKLVPNTPDFLDTRGHIFLALRRLDEAIADFTRAIDLGLKRSPPFYGRGRAYELAGNVERAVADFRKASSLPASTLDEKWATAQAVEGLERQLAAVSSTKTGPSTAPSTGKVTLRERRVAFVIGNARYRNAPLLVNPANDARAVAAAFRQLGFAEVIERHDLDRVSLEAELKQFGDAARESDWAVIYFAGHGLQVDGKSYLIPTDARLLQAAHVEDEAIDVTRLISKVRDARKIRMVLLDACRDNPFIAKMRQSGRLTRAVSRGLAPIEPSAGVLVAYAARDGQLASDGARDHSPFTAAFLRHIETPNLEINFLFRKVRSDVLAATGGVQEPFVYGSLPDERFYFKLVADLTAKQ